MVELFSRPTPLAAMPDTNELSRRQQRAKRKVVRDHKLRAAMIEQMLLGRKNKPKYAPKPPKYSAAHVHKRNGEKLRRILQIMGSDRVGVTLKKENGLV